MLADEHAQKRTHTNQSVSSFLTPRLQLVTYQPRSAIIIIGGVSALHGRKHQDRHCDADWPNTTESRHPMEGDRTPIT